MSNRLVACRGPAAGVRSADLDVVRDRDVVEGWASVATWIGTCRADEADCGMDQSVVRDPYPMYRRRRVGLQVHGESPGVGHHVVVERDARSTDHGETLPARADELVSRDCHSVRRVRDTEEVTPDRTHRAAFHGDIGAVVDRNPRLALVIVMEQRGLRLRSDDLHRDDPDAARALDQPLRIEYTGFRVHTRERRAPAVDGEIVAAGNLDGAVDPEARPCTEGDGGAVAGLCDSGIDRSRLVRCTAATTIRLRCTTALPGSAAPACGETAQEHDGQRSDLCTLPMPRTTGRSRRTPR